MAHCTLKGKWRTKVWWQPIRRCFSSNMKRLWKSQLEQATSSLCYSKSVCGRYYGVCTFLWVSNAVMWVCEHCFLWNGCFSGAAEQTREVDQFSEMYSNRSVGCTHAHTRPRTHTHHCGAPKHECLFNQTWSGSSNLMKSCNIPFHHTIENISSSHERENETWLTQCSYFLCVNNVIYITHLKE